MRRWDDDLRIGKVWEVDGQPSVHAVLGPEIRYAAAHGHPRTRQHCHRTKEVTGESLYVKIFSKIIPVVCVSQSWGSGSASGSDP
jgi:hypothetical protein